MSRVIDLHIVPLIQGHIAPEGSLVEQVNLHHGRAGERSNRNGKAGMNQNTRSEYYIGVVFVVTAAVTYSTAGLFTKGVEAGSWEVIFC